MINVTLDVPTTLRQARAFRMLRRRLRKTSSGFRARTFRIAAASDYTVGLRVMCL